MKLTIEIDDGIIDDVRHAFLRQDNPATDEQLVEVCLAHLVNTTAYIIESEERAAASTRKSAFLSKAGVAEALAEPVEAVAEARV